MKVHSRMLAATLLLACSAPGMAETILINALSNGPICPGDRAKLKDQIGLIVYPSRRCKLPIDAAKNMVFAEHRSVLGVDPGCVGQSLSKDIIFISAEGNTEATSPDLLGRAELDSTGNLVINKAASAGTIAEDCAKGKPR